jgi:hypothetical protein
MPVMNQTAEAIMTEEKKQQFYLLDKEDLLHQKNSRESLFMN